MNLEMLLATALYAASTTNVGEAQIDAHLILGNISQ